MIVALNPMGYEANHSVLIADDHAIFRQRLATIINRDPDMQVIAQLKMGTSDRAIRRNQPDVTLMDLRMPEVEDIGAICAMLNLLELLY